MPEFEIDMIRQPTMHHGCVLTNFEAVGKQQGEFVKKNQLTLVIIIDTHPSLSKN